MKKKDFKLQISRRLENGKWVVKMTWVGAGYEECTSHQQDGGDMQFSLDSAEYGLPEIEYIY